MTKDELILIKELIKESVRAVIREEIESINKKDFKQVKLLLTKIIKESANNGGNYPIMENKSSGISKEELRKMVSGGDWPTKGARLNENRSMPALNISQEQATNISVNGTLPDIDAPIPFIDKSSMAWKAMEEKIH